MSLQVTLKRGEAASDTVCNTALEQKSTALIQDPWMHNSPVAGLSNIKGKLIYCRIIGKSRACIVIRNGTESLP